MSNTETKEAGSQETATTSSQESPKEAQRRHHVHFQLKKAGIVIDPEKRTISLSEEMKAKLTKNQKGWVDELVRDHKYAIQSAIHIQPTNIKPMENTPGQFFTSLSPHLEDCGIRLVIDKIGDQLSVSMLPQTKKDGVPFKLTPLNFQGTAQEIDEGFFPELAKAFEKLTEAGLKTNASDFAEGVTAIKANGKHAKKTASKKAASKPAKAKPAAKEKPKPKPKPKPVPPPYYTEDEQKQIKTRLDSMRSELEKEEAGLITLTQAQPSNKQYAAMLKAPQAKLKKVNEAMKQLEAKKLGLKGKKLVPIAQLVKNPI